MKKVVFAKRATNALGKYANRASLITAKIAQYANNPASLTNNVTELVGRDGKRLRVGEFRVLFTETADTIFVDEIGPRGDIYD